jgi:hypothetical protein
MRVGGWTSNQYLDYMAFACSLHICISNHVGPSRGDLPDLRLGVMQR